MMGALNCSSMVRWSASQVTAAFLFLNLSDHVTQIQLTAGTLLVRCGALTTSNHRLRPAESAPDHGMEPNKRLFASTVRIEAPFHVASRNTLPPGARHIRIACLSASL